MLVIVLLGCVVFGAGWRMLSRRDDLWLGLGIFLAMIGVVIVIYGLAFH